MTYALGESWCSDGSIASCNNYELLWAKEFRYDNARARYLVNELDTGLLLSGIVSVTAQNASSYDGDDIVRDAFAHYEPGLSRVMPPFTTNGGQDTMYYHNDHLGTTRLMSDASGKAATGWHSTGGGPTDVTPSVFTAFGEPITGPLNGDSNRYGYVGEYGYQAHDEMPYLHVGHRYYDPAAGRFLQRDPIGTGGGLNVFEYVRSSPTLWIDIDGTERHSRRHPKGSPGGKGGQYKKKPWWKRGGKGKAGLVGLCLALIEREVVPRVDKWIEKDYRKKMKEINNPSPPSRSRPSTGGWIGCFVAGTLVSTGAGEIPIEQLREGDSIFSFDVTSMTQETGSVTKTMSFIVNEVVELTLPREKITTTANHPFWVVGCGWVEASELAQGDLLLNASGETVAIQRAVTKRLKEPIRVYNLTVSDTSNYFIGTTRLLVHNKNV